MKIDLQHLNNAHTRKARKLKALKPVNMHYIHFFLLSSYL